METKSHKLVTPLGKSYWGQDGAYQNLYDSLWEQLVPASGYATTIHGEMLRSISRLFYDFCNNGNCNVLDLKMDTCHNCDGCGYQEVFYSEDEDAEPETEDCYVCDGAGEVQDEVYITEYYEEMVDFLQEFMNEKQSIFNLKKFLIDEYSIRYSFSDKQMDIYNKVVDAVMYQVLNTNDKPNPYFKSEE